MSEEEKLLAVLDNCNWYTVKYPSRGIRERVKKAVMIAKERAGWCQLLCHPLVAAHRHLNINKLKL